MNSPYVSASLPRRYFASAPGRLKRQPVEPPLLFRPYPDRKIAVKTQKALSCSCKFPIFFVRLSQKVICGFRRNLTLELCPYLIRLSQNRFFEPLARQPAPPKKTAPCFALSLLAFCSWICFFPTRKMPLLHLARCLLVLLLELLYLFLQIVRLLCRGG